MEEKPGIIMQCPKCSREFSPDVCYCDACSAMLEPVEILSQQVGSGEDLPNSSGTTITKGKDKILQNKILDDVKIDSLKTDMEQRFVRTLLLELEQLKKRFISGDNQLSGNEDAHFHPGDGEGNRANEIIEKRITKLEAILCNLEKKIEADISDMETRLDSLGKP